MGSSLHQYLWIHLRVVWIKNAQLNADCQEANRGCIRGKSEESIPRRWRSTQVRDQPWLYITKSPKQGYWNQWPYKKDLHPPKIKRKKKKKLQIVPSLWAGLNCFFFYYSLPRCKIRSVHHCRFKTLQCQTKQVGKLLLLSTRSISE